jgi:spore coat protein U-like protein
MHRRPLALAVVAVLAFAPPVARANVNPHPATRAMPRVNHQQHCFVSGPPLQIGAYDPQDVTPMRTTVAWRFRCDGGESVPDLTLESAGANGAAFTMINERGDVLSYEVCSEAACAAPLGAQLGDLNLAVHLGPAASDGTMAGTILLYVLIPARQAVPAGSYHDTLTITFGS